jgi:hypothetical protein
MINKKLLLEQLSVCAAKYTSRALFSLFILGLCQVGIVSVLGGPALLLLSKKTASVLTFIAAGTLFFLLFTIMALLQFGYSVLLLRMKRNQYVTLGFLFNGFRSWRRVLSSAIFVAVIICSVVCILEAGMYFLKTPLSLFVTKFGTTAQQVLVGVLFAILLFIFTIHFVFLFQIRYDRPELPLFKVLRKSVHLMRRHVWTFVSIVLRAGGYQLLTAIIIFIINMIISDTKSHTIAVISLILDFIYFVNGYTAVVRMYLSVPILYDYLDGIDSHTVTDVQTLPAHS